MTTVTPERLRLAAHMLWEGIYEAEFRGKERGRFLLTRAQLKKVLNVERLHGTTIQSFQDAALELGLIIIDLDDVFPCIETRMARRYRRPPTALLNRHLAETFP
ncbi:hypothetical protein, partial [Methylobacterium frigidaeris]